MAFAFVAEDGAVVEGQFRLLHQALRQLFVCQSKMAEIEPQKISCLMAEHFDLTLKMCEESSNAETTYHALWSNQCIELWFLLHFSFLQADLHRSAYWPKLSECLNSIGVGDYRKNRDDMFDVLYPYIDSAISNAKKLDEINSGKKPSESAPGTKVYQIIEHLRNYL